MSLQTVGEKDILKDNQVMWKVRIVDQKYWGNIDQKYWSEILIRNIGQGNEVDGEVKGCDGHYIRRSVWSRGLE